MQAVAQWILGERFPGSLSPYLPLETEEVTRNVLGELEAHTQVVYDLGCGDGRVVLAAAQRGCRR